MVSSISRSSAGRNKWGWQFDESFDYDDDGDGDGNGDVDGGIFLGGHGDDDDDVNGRDGERWSMMVMMIDE